MPPIRRKTAKRKMVKKSSQTRRRNIARRPVRNYNRQSGNFQRKSLNMLQIKTLTPKELQVGIQYKTVISVSSMGYGASGNLSGTNTILRLSLNNPCKGVAGNNSIVDILSLGGTHTDPVFTRTNSELSLNSQLQQYFEQYGKAVVTSANAKVRVLSKPNQHKLGQWFNNIDAQGAQPGGGAQNYDWDENHPQLLNVNEPNIDGQSFVWSVKTRSTGLLQQAPGGDTPTYHELQTAIPGMKMKALTAYRDGHSTAPIMCNASFTPRFFGTRDWRDNLQKQQFRKSGTNEPDVVNRAYFYVGVCNRQPAVSTLKPQNVDFEVTVNYNCRYIQRANDVDGLDEPIPIPVHGEEL